jgi:hypothetical protein
MRVHCEERSDEAIHGPGALDVRVDCFAALAMAARLRDKTANARYVPTSRRPWSYPR